MESLDGGSHTPSEMEELAEYYTDQLTKCQDRVQNRVTRRHQRQPSGSQADFANHLDHIRPSSRPSRGRCADDPVPEQPVYTNENENLEPIEETQD